MNTHKFDLPLVLPVAFLKFETKTQATITLEVVIPKQYSLSIQPGQYFMLWLPQIDEIPISVSNFEKNRLAFTICSKGYTSKQMMTMQKGDLLGLRGPFGKGFEIHPENVAIIVAGGMGITPLRYLIYNLLKIKTKQIILLQGAKTASELYFQEELKYLDIKTFFYTDDGSYGQKGFPTQKLLALLNNTQNHNELALYGCGPEIMLKQILEIAKTNHIQHQVQLSLADRYIRCGYGICGSCYLDDIGLSVCHDGPVFRGDILEQIKDFGNFGRKADGSKYKL
ncbi:MAG: dihydroorotate dehydrogenase electron transfer subunit [Candidatus Heimdallarchaeota archaeon]|nr:dihydroorotate dehydrogenase electron transfer subunit [Candidatus Heimdallarchaeota archaeon]